jgi:hypothetical protein
MDGFINQSKVVLSREVPFDEVFPSKLPLNELIGITRERIKTVLKKIPMADDVCAARGNVVMLHHAQYRSIPCSPAENVLQDDERKPTNPMPIETKPNPIWIPPETHPQVSLFPSDLG